MGCFKATLLAEQKSERDNGVSPASAYARNAHGGATAEALNNLAATTAADYQAEANQLEAVANLDSTNQQLAHRCSTNLEAYFNGIDDLLFMEDKANQPYSEGQTLTAVSIAITKP